MPRKLFAWLLVASITKMGRFSTLFCAWPCKALFWRRESCSCWAVFFLGLGILPAAAEPQCGMRDSLHRGLLQTYLESPAFIAITNSGALVEVLITESGNTWSILVTTPDGISCLVAAGENWRAVAGPLPGQGS